MDNNQFFPTPPSLSRRAWGKFQNRDFSRVFDGSAGEGDLLKYAPWTQSRYSRENIVDCCEIDISKHGVLREKGYNVVGMDFLEYQDAASVSHFILNPPFNQGAKHVLKAWELLWDGEIVAIVNAETVRNPYSLERQELQHLIECYGTVEFIQDAFNTPEARIKTDVEVALIYLRKEADMGNLFGNLLDDLGEDHTSDKSIEREFDDMHELALPTSVIENSVRVFGAAVRTLREAVHAEARSRYYAKLLGDTLAVRNGDVGSLKQDHSVDFVKKEYGTRYAELKDRAWAAVLRSSDVQSKLSSKAQKRVESEFEQIKKLDFTLENIYGFLHGIVLSQGQIQDQMVLDVFDLISRYHENVAYFRGWKSNGKHRTCGRRLKHTRFILPVTGSYSNSLSWDSEKMLQDLDKTFAMIDGKLNVPNDLVATFRSQWNTLKHGERVTTAYFDVRYYRGVGSIHFYPKNQEVMDRLNRWVGRLRQWLPQEHEEAQSNTDFWKQYDKAETLTKELEKELKRTNVRSWGRDPFHDLGSRDDDVRLRAEAAIDAAQCAVHKSRGINVDRLIETRPSSQQLLLAA